MTTKLSRRKFLMGTVGMLSAVTAHRLIAQMDHGTPFEIVHRNFPAMGTNVSITVATHQPELTGRAITDAISQVHKIESLLSLYQSGSQVSLLNQNGYLNDPHPHLLAVLNAAQTISEQTAGAFDITVQPLWETHTGQSTLTVTHARHHVNWHRLKVTPERVWFNEPGMKITLNGIAQGYITDQIMAVLHHHGLRHMLVSGGEVGVYGQRIDQPWRIGLQHPRDTDLLLGVLSMTNGFLATSGDYATAFSPDFAHHHIFDPITGISPMELASVSVLAPSAMLADGWSTALMVLGVQAGSEVLASQPDIAACFVTKEGEVLLSEGFPSFNRDV